MNDIIFICQVEFDHPVPLYSGRIITVKLRHTYRLYDTVSRLLVSAFRKEF